MNITNVHVRLIQKEGRVKAIAAVTLDDRFVVHDIRVIEGNDGLFVAMPSRRLQNGEFRDIAHPINVETRKLFEDAILEQYEVALTEEPAEENTEIEETETVGQNSDEAVDDVDSVQE
jgi:stage V sporulation protein G